jgi:hypothetical protein
MVIPTGPEGSGSGTAGSTASSGSGGTLGSPLTPAGSNAATAGTVVRKGTANKGRNSWTKRAFDAIFSSVNGGKDKDKDKDNGNDNGNAADDSTPLSPDSKSEATPTSPPAASASGASTPTPSALPPPHPSSGAGGGTLRAHRLSKGALSIAPSAKPSATVPISLLMPALSKQPSKSALLSGSSGGTIGAGGAAGLLGGSSLSRVRVFLFNDMILWTTAPKEGPGKFIDVIELRQCDIRDYGQVSAERSHLHAHTRAYAYSTADVVPDLTRLRVRLPTAVWCVCRCLSCIITTNV